MVVARTLVRQTGFMQDPIDPNPGSHWKCAAEIADATGTYCSPECAQQPGPMLLIVPVALRLVRVPGWWSCRRHIRLVNPIAGVRHARSDFVRRANAVRPITYLAALASTLIMGSPRHHPIVIRERASVCLTSPSASMISCFTMSRVCRGHSKERPNVPPSLVHLSQAPQGFCPSRGKAGFFGNTALLDEGCPDRSGECFKANAWAVGGIRFAKLFLPPGYLMYQNRGLRSGLSPMTQENSHGRSQATIHHRRRF